MDVKSVQRYLLVVAAVIDVLSQGSMMFSQRRLGVVGECVFCRSDDLAEN